MEDILDYVLTFGKHKGQTVWEIAESDPKWLDWAAANVSGQNGKILKKAVQHPEVSKRIDRAVYEE